jgi:hypothetical protein
MTLLIRNKFRHYAILVTPALDLLLAFYLLRFFRKPWQGKVQDYANRAAWVLLAVAVAFNWSVVREAPLEPYQRVEEMLRSSVEPGDRLLGPQTYWFGLYDYHFSDWLQLVIYQRSAPGSSLKDAFHALHPDVLSSTAPWRFLSPISPGIHPSYSISSSRGWSWRNFWLPTPPWSLRMMIRPGSPFAFIALIGKVLKSL